MSVLAKVIKFKHAPIQLSLPLTLDQATVLLAIIGKERQGWDRDSVVGQVHRALQDLVHDGIEEEQRRR